MIPQLDARRIDDADPRALRALARAARDTGFFTVTDTGLGPERMARVLDAYRSFFSLPEAEKREIDMARTGANRGWGASLSEQVDPGMNPDYKQVFDMGFEAPDTGLAVYAPNLWPARPAGFRAELEAYYADARGVAMRLLRGIAEAIGRDRSAFDDAFARPMALLRGNWYPPRPAAAGARDWGIAPHTDYGCLTLLATDGAPGLEVETRDGWRGVQAQPGTFVVNFGEMLEIWTAGEVRATRHRVRGSAEPRLSVPLFFNPDHDADVAPPGSDRVIRAGDHLTRRFSETYLHLKTG